MSGLLPLYALENIVRGTSPEQDEQLRRSRPAAAAARSLSWWADSSPETYSTFASSPRAAADLQHQRRLADARRAADEHQRALDRCRRRARGRVHPCRLRSGSPPLLSISAIGAALRLRCSAQRCALPLAAGAFSRLLHHGVPRAARAAPPRPLRGSRCRTPCRKKRFLPSSCPSFVLYCSQPGQQWPRPAAAGAPPSADARLPPSFERNPHSTSTPGHRIVLHQIDARRPSP